MEKTITDVLDAIENAGFEAYIVGGYVRDLIRGYQTTDIDICTNALPKDLNEIFKIGNTRDDIYGAYKIVTGKYNFDITTYRKDLNYIGRKPTEIEYVSNLITDLERRDFTINSLCLNRNNEIIDLLGGKEDIDNKIIRVIGDVKTKLTEDPLRILRALRFSVTLDFDIDEEIIEFIKNNKELLKTLSVSRKKYEIQSILLSENLEKGIKLIKELDLEDSLGVKIPDKLISVSDINGMWAQVEVLEDNFFTKEEKSMRKSIQNILEYGKIDNNVLFEHGLYNSGVAGRILGLEIKDINEQFEALPIKNIKDIDITSEVIINLFKIEPSVIIKEIMNDVKEEILNNKLGNNRESIIKYLNEFRGKWFK